jgi:hypothetical protein
MREVQGRKLASDYEVCTDVRVLAPLSHHRSSVSLPRVSHTHRTRIVSRSLVGVGVGVGMGVGVGVGVG